MFLANHLKILTKIKFRLNVLDKVEFLLLFIIRKIGTPWHATKQNLARLAARRRRY
jgi:hypothetical protein